MKISVVTTLYRSQSFIHEFHGRTRAALEELGVDYEFVFVNDGSPDDSLSVAVELSHVDPGVRVIDLTRNFGHHAAIRAGLREATGDYVFLIDVDLEEAPENLVAFYQNLISIPDTDAVYGVWRRHGEPWLRRVAADAYYRVFNMLSDTAVPRNLVVSRLMTRRYIDALLDAWQGSVPPAPLMASIGFTQREREIERLYKGWSTYSVRGRLNILVDSVTSFSARPLHYIFATGVLTCALAIAMTTYAVVAYMVAGQPVYGWYSVFVSIWFIGGLVMMSMGVLGLYIARIFDQVKGRPVAIVRQRYGGTDPEMPSMRSSMSRESL